MGKKTTELFTPYTQQATLAEPRLPLRIRITPTSKYGRRGYYLDNWLPVPAWTRRFDGWTFGAVVRLTALALGAAAVGIWWALRLLGRAR